MPELVILRGLPASGKTTWARMWVSEDPGNRVRVNRDDIRSQFFGSPTHEHAQEKAVTAAEHSMVEALLRSGVSVVVDNTNLRPRYVRAFLRIARRVGAPSTIIAIPIDVETAIKRDHNRHNPVGEDVIRRMAERFLRNGQLLPVSVSDADPSVGAPYVPNPKLPMAVLVDIDGTVAINDHRDFHDYDKVGSDKPNWPVIRIIWALRRAGFVLVFMSGRPDSCRDETVRWLNKHVGGAFDGPFMRATGDYRNDAVIKPELFDRHVRHRYNVLASFDDRNRVVKAWRDMGITCMQVAEGDF